MWDGNIPLSQRRERVRFPETQVGWDGTPLSLKGGSACPGDAGRAGRTSWDARVQVGEASGPQVEAYTRVRQAHTCTHCTALTGRAVCAVITDCGHSRLG